mgnify:FL=1
MLKTLAESLRSVVNKILHAPIVDKRLIEEIIRDIQRALLKADVNVRLVLSISNSIREKALKVEVPPGFSRKDVIIRLIYEELVKILGGETKPDVSIGRGKGYVIMLVGIQGSGKTTSAAKLAYFYKRRGYKVGLVCADTFRPGAQEQLRQLANKVGVPFFGVKEAGSKDPIEIAVKGVEYFKKSNYDLIIIDTAGRHKNEKDLMAEMKELSKNIAPDEVMLVIDATIGQQAGVQAKAFHETVKVGSILVTKLDGTARGGGALSAVAATGAKIKFIGVGEKIEELEVFDPPSFVSRLLGMGDIKSLVERMKQVELLREESVKRIMRGKLTLEDLYQQLITLRKLGPLRKVLELVPGFMLSMDETKIDIADEKLDKWIAILQSMTKEELMNPRIINRSRMQRIARGSGTTVSDVKELLDYYQVLSRSLKKIMRRSRRFGGIRFPGVNLR